MYLNGSNLLVNMSRTKRIIGLEVAPAFVGCAFVAAFGIPMYMNWHNHDLFMEKPTVSLECTVTGERYVPPVAGSWPHGRRESQYFFSCADGEDRLSIQVLDVYRGTQKESIDALLNQGTAVRVQARKTGANEYTAFANQILAK